MTIATPLIVDRTYLRHFWHPVCTVAELAQTGEDGAGPLAATLLDEDIVIARLDGAIAALADRCAHLFAKLSLGKVTGGNIQCPYHGWQYDGTGMCMRVPAAPDMKLPKKPLVGSYECREKYDLVWVRLDSSWDCRKFPIAAPGKTRTSKRSSSPNPMNGKARPNAGGRILPTFPIRLCATRHAVRPGL
jgi:vanillate O-demethylase monooxygenase subunit